MRSYAFSLLANAIQDLKLKGSHLRVIEATNDVYIAFDNSPFVKFKAGQGITTEKGGVSDLRIKSLVAQNILLVAGEGQFHDSNDSVSVTTTATVESSNTITPKAQVLIAAGATVILAAANANRKELRIGVKSSEANGVYIGNAAVGAATQGGYIEEGAIEYVATEAAVYGYNSGGGAITVNVLELTKI